MAFKFQTFDADGEVFEIPAGQPFTTYWTVDGDAIEAAAINHPWNALDHYELADLQRFRIARTTIADPPAPRAALPKSTVMARVFALGKAAQVKALFDANFELEAKWQSPDWPNVYVDDEGLMQALAVIGLTEDQIAEVVAV